MSKTAGIIIIGNEILSGKTQDSNSYFLCTELRALGVDVQRISVIPDEIQLIGAEAAAFAKKWDFVFTTGGVGPTHDDVTMAGIAHGFGVKVILHPDIERRLHARHGKNINEARLRLAELPEGSELIGTDSMYAPVAKFRNIYIFPGIPKILYDRFHAIKERFRDAPFHLKVVYVKETEGTIASTLNKLQASFPKLGLGSYPVLGDPNFKVKLTLESKEKDYLNQAFEKLLSALPSGAIHCIEEH
jgi:molybdenum cofactor synthesis domain-containing protein